MMIQWCLGDLLLIKDGRFRPGVVDDFHLYCSSVHARKLLKASHLYDAISSKMDAA